MIAYTNTRFTKSTKQLQPRVLDKECFSVRFFLNGTVSLTKVCYTLEHLNSNSITIAYIVLQKMFQQVYLKGCVTLEECYNSGSHEPFVRPPQNLHFKRPQSLVISWLCRSPGRHHHHHHHHQQTC